MQEQDAMQFDRDTISRRLIERRMSGQAIVAASAGIGLVGRSVEAAGADLLMILATGRSRHLGVPTTTTLGNATQITLETFPEIANVVTRTPIIGGIEATDSTRRLQRSVQQYIELGFHGIANFPSIGATPRWAEMRRSVGEGIDQEISLIEQARRAGTFAVAHVYSPAYAAEFAAAGADVLVVRCGPTAGGFSGPPLERYSLSESIRFVEDVTTRARAVDRDIFVLAHGGPFGSKDGLAELYQAVEVDGMLGESAIERIPIESAVSACIREFKEQSLRSQSSAGAQ